MMAVSDVYVQLSVGAYRLGCESGETIDVWDGSEVEVEVWITRRTLPIATLRYGQIYSAVCPLTAFGPASVSAG